MTNELQRHRSVKQKQLDSSRFRCLYREGDYVSKAGVRRPVGHKREVLMARTNHRVADNCPAKLFGQRIRRTTVERAWATRVCQGRWAVNAVDSFSTAPYLNSLSALALSGQGRIRCRQGGVGNLGGISCVASTNAARTAGCKLPRAVSRGKGPSVQLIAGIMLRAKA